MKKAVFKLGVHDDKSRRKAMKTVCTVSGVVSMSMDMKNQKLTVIGDFDPVDVARKVRKLYLTEIISVGPGKHLESRATDKGNGKGMDCSNIDLFWNHAVKIDDGCMKCKFCGCPFAKDGYILSIKCHLSGEKGHGVTICTGQVPEDIQEAAFLAVHGNKRQKTIASSCNVNDNAISSCPQAENEEVFYPARDVGRVQMAAVQDREQGVEERRTSSRAEVGNLMENMAEEMMHIDRSITAEELIVDAHENRGEALQLPRL